jgi:hypothetical protein
LAGPLTLDITGATLSLTEMAKDFSKYKAPESVDRMRTLYDPADKALAPTSRFVPEIENEALSVEPVPETKE